MSFSLLATDRINLRTKRYRRCHKPEPVGIFYTVWYVNLFDQEQVAKKEMATTVTIYRLFVNGDTENGTAHLLMVCDKCVCVC